MRGERSSKVLPEVVIEAHVFDWLADIVDAMPSRLSHVSSLLRQELDRAKIIQEPAEGVVTLNTSVRFSYEGAEDCKWVRLVFPEAADVDAGLIPVTSLLGVALIGLSEGAVMPWVDRDGAHRSLIVHAIE